MKDFSIGLLVGLAFFLAPGLIMDNGGLLGADLFSGLLDLGILGVTLLGILYAATGGVLYGFILKLKIFPQIAKNL